MKFKDFLHSSEDYDGEVYSVDLEESRHSFNWCNSDIQITRAGCRKFNKILNSEIHLVGNGNIKLLDKEITQEEYDLFMEAVAGYVSCTEFDKWFAWRKSQ